MGCDQQNNNRDCVLFSIANAIKLFSGFGVRVSVTFHLMCVHIIFSSVRLLSGHLLENSCSLG